MSQRQPETDERLVRAWLSIRSGYDHVVARVEGRVGSVTGRPPAWSGLLRFLRAQPEGRATMHEIADALAMSSGGLTRLVDRMADDGVLTRSSLPTDRRVVLATITSEGQRIADLARAAEVDVLRTELFGRLTREQITQLEALADSLRRGEPPGG